VGRILFVTWAGGGNVPPVLALADRLVARGHEVRAMGSGSLADRFEARGIPFLAREVLVEWDQAALAREVRLEAGTADLVVSDYMLPGALCGAEASYRPSLALVHTLYAANLDGAGGLLPMGMAATIDGTAAVRAELDLAPVATFGALLDRQSSVLVTCPEALDEPGRPRADNVRYVGPLLEDAGPDAGWRPPGVDDGRPLVVVGLGTTPMDEGPVLQRILAALGDAPVRVLATLGDHLDPDDLTVPSNVALSGHVRHAALLPWASAVVSHGGLGTVLAALAHGLPQVCVPLGREQPLNAAAVERVGAGLAVEPTAADDVFERAVLRALGDLELRAGAARMALTIDAQRQAADAEAEVERHLDLR
jgi:UDP:flavonoid glycosyltransferase YjiC (YdhE family)